MACPLTGSMRSTLCAWGRVQVLMKPDRLVPSPSAPLWFNPKFSHFGETPDSIVWARVGIKQLQDIMGWGRFLTFDQLRSKYHHQNWYFFCYLQLRHAFIAQFGSETLKLSSSPLEQLLCDDSLKKPPYLRCIKNCL